MFSDAMISEQLRCGAVSMEANALHAQAVGRRGRPITRRLARCNASTQSSSYPTNDSNRISRLARRPTGPRSFEPGFELGRPSATVAELSYTSSSIPAKPGALLPKISSKRLRVAVDVDEGERGTETETGMVVSYSGSLNFVVRAPAHAGLRAVLGRFLHSLNKFCLDEYGLEYDVSDYHVYDFAKVWKCSQDESNHKVHEFFKSHHFASGIEVIPGSYEALMRLKKVGHSLVVVTSRQHVIQQPTLDWLSTHFGDIFEDVYFGNHFALQGASRKKSEICRAIGATVLIDDNPNYALECANEGMHVLLYDWNSGYPWSKQIGTGAEGSRSQPHERITRVQDWNEVESAVEILVQAS